MFAKQVSRMALKGSLRVLLNVVFSRHVGLTGTASTRTLPTPQPVYSVVVTLLFLYTGDIHYTVCNLCITHTYEHS